MELLKNISDSEEEKSPKEGNRKEGEGAATEIEVAPEVDVSKIAEEVQRQQWAKLESETIISGK